MPAPPLLELRSSHHNLRKHNNNKIKGGIEKRHTHENYGIVYKGGRRLYSMNKIKWNKELLK